MGKKLAVIGIGVLVLIGVGILYFSLNRVIRSAIETYGPRATKSEVRLGGVSVSPFSGNASLSNLVVGNPQGFKTPSAFTMESMQVSLNVGSVMSDTVAIREIIISAPEITYELGPGGSNLAVLQKNVEAFSGGGAKEGEQAPPAPQGGKKVTIDRLRVERAKLLVSAAPVQAEPVTLTLPDIELKNLGKGNQGVSLAAATEQLLEEINRQAAKAVASVDIKGLAEKSRKEAEGAAGGVGEKLKGLLGK